MHLGFISVCWGLGGQGEGSRGPKVTRRLGHGKCPPDAKLHISITSTFYHPPSMGSGVRMWKFCHLLSLLHLSVPQFPHLPNGGDSSSCHIERPQGLDATLYGMSLTCWLAHGESSAKLSERCCYFFIIFTNAAPFKWPNLFFYSWYLSGLILKNLEYQGLSNVL